METFLFMESLPGEKVIDLCCALCKKRSPPKQQWLQGTEEFQCSSVWNGNHVEELAFFFRGLFSQEFPPSPARCRLKHGVQCMECNPSSSPHSGAFLIEGARGSDSG